MEESLDGKELQRVLFGEQVDVRIRGYSTSRKRSTKLIYPKIKRTSELVLKTTKKGGKQTNQYVRSQYQISLKNGNTPKTHDSSRKTSKLEPRFPFLREADDASAFSADI